MWIESKSKSGLINLSNITLIYKHDKDADDKAVPCIYFKLDSPLMVELFETEQERDERFDYLKTLILQHTLQN